MDNMDFIPLDELWKRYPNKFFAIVLAAKKARYISRKARERGEYLDKKPTIIALREVLEGKVEYTFVSRKKQIFQDLNMEDEGPVGSNR